MKIRNAENKDIPRLLELLEVVRKVHSDARPDVFRNENVKYNHEDLIEIMSDTDKPIFVAVDEAETVLGYAFCQIRESRDHAVLLPSKMLYLDDLCVDDSGRSRGVGSTLLDNCKSYAKAAGCSRVELNVWEFPGSALDFYERQGFQTQRRELEFWL